MEKSKALVYEFVQHEIYTNSSLSEGLSTTYIAKSLHLQRSNTSKLLNQLVNEGLLIKTASRPVLYRLVESLEEKRNFDTLIGVNGSLKKAIQLAKAAVLYPKASLNILIQAKQGCGTSFFVDKIVEFAKERKVITPEAPYMRVNCRNYSKDPSLLNDELFGEKADFIGSCFDLAWSGVLFIDHYDLLYARQQSKIFDFLNSGINQFDPIKADDRNKKVIVILSTTPEHQLQISQMVPIVIELPEWKKRSSPEQFELINHFFSLEATHSRRTIIVPTEVVRALLLCEFVYNLNELKIEIKAACANGYVRVVNMEEADITLSLEDFKPSIKKSLLRIKENYLVFDELFGTVENVIYDKETGYQKEYGKSDNHDFYLEIKKQYQTLSKSGVNDSSITNVINKYIQNLLNKYNYYNVFDEDHNIDQLAKIINPKIIGLVRSWLNTCQKTVHRNFRSSVFYGLCLHINSLLTINAHRKETPNVEMVQIIQKYPEEYALSVQLALLLKEHFDLELPTDEIVLIMMFLIEPEESYSTGHPVLLYIMHGNQTASSLAETTNLLTKTNNIYSYDMNLDITPSQAMAEIKQLILTIDQGQGVLVIYDMGSIKTIIEAISEEINSKLRLIYLPITLVGIEVARKSSMESDIDYVYHTVNMDLNNLLNKEEKRNEMIITLCHTGEGGAEQLKRYIEQYSKLGMKIKALAISSRNQLIQEVLSLKKIYKIHAFVGTYDPKIFGIPFLSIGKVFENSKEELDRLLMFEPVTSNFFDYTEVYNYLEESFRYASIAKLKMVLPETMDEISHQYPLDIDQSIGLFMHLACLIERLLEGKRIEKKEAKQKILATFKEDALEISKILKKLERAFKVIINNDDLATIIMIIKKI